MQVSKTDDVLVVKPDAQDAVDLWSHLKRILEEHHGSVVLDVADIGYLNSVNIAAIISARNRVRQNDGICVLANLNEQMKAVFRILKLDRLFELDYDLAGAQRGALADGAS